MNFAHIAISKRLHAGLGLLLAVVAMVTVSAMVWEQAMDAALRANSDDRAIQRYAINFRSSAHDRSIATRDLVLAAAAADQKKEVAALDSLANFHADSAGPLEKLIGNAGAAGELGRLYAAMKDIEAHSVASTKALTKSGDLT